MFSCDGMKSKLPEGNNDPGEMKPSTGDRVTVEGKIPHKGLDNTIFLPMPMPPTTPQIQSSISNVETTKVTPAPWKVLR